MGLNITLALAAVIWMFNLNIVSAVNFNFTDVYTSAEEKGIFKKRLEGAANITEESRLPTELPVYWLGQPAFHAIHSTALVSCSISIICSSSVIIFLFVMEHRTKRRSFYRWTIGERLVVYLAVFDLGFSTSHTFDHAYMYAVYDHPPVPICVTFAFLIVQFILGQSLVVLFTALSAYLLVIHQKKMKLGRGDWKLLLFALGIPGLFCTFGVIFKYIGASGTWCIMYMGSHLGKLMNNVKAGVMLTVFFTCSFCYAVIWCKMRESGPLEEAEEHEQRRQRYHRSARVMLLFVVAYVAQWWPWVVNAIWALSGQPQPWIIVLVVFFCNMGGVFNGFAYTIMRRKYLQVNTGNTLRRNNRTPCSVESNTGSSSV